MRTMQQIVGGTLILLVALAVQAMAAAPVFTGNVQHDFTDPDVVTVVDPRDVYMATDYGSAVTGWDIAEVRLYYDMPADTLYVGVVTFGIAGDADGDGDPGGTGPVLSRLLGRDIPDMGPGETFYMKVDLNQDRVCDIVVGVPDAASLRGGFTAAVCDDWALTAPFGAALTGVTTEVFASPSAAVPHLEFKVAGLANAPGFTRDATGITMSMAIAMGSGADAGIGADFLSTGWFHVPPLGAIGDLIWSDDDGDGLQDPGEPGIAGVTVDLYRDLNGNGAVDTGDEWLASTVTDSAGHYLFANLPRDAYLVAVLGSENLVSLLSVSAEGTDPLDGLVLTGGMDPYPVPLAEGQTFLDADMGYHLPEPPPPQPDDASLTGFVYLDVNGNGTQDAGEPGLEGIVILVTDHEDAPLAQATTAADGSWAATVTAGTEVTVDVQNPPAGTLLTEGTDPVEFGTESGATYVVIHGYAPLVPLGTGEAATIGFWRNRNGQALILSLNPVVAGTTNSEEADKALSAWLAVTFPNLWGSEAGENDLTGKTREEVAAYVKRLFRLRGMKLEAQVLAVALAVYVTNPELAGGDMAAGYGFTVALPGTGGAAYNVGSSGAAFGVTNGTTLTVLEILQAADARVVGGVLYGGDKVLRSLANEVFTGINEDGDIL